ncbi:MAG: VWA domain-containing protein [Blastocatellia bacterium]
MKNSQGIHLAYLGAYVLLLALLLSAPLLAQNKKDGETTMRIRTALVTVPVIAMDREEKVVPNLRREDFQIAEEGVNQEIDFFYSAEEPVSVALLLDVSDSTEFRLREIQQAAAAFIEQLRPDDRMMVVAFDGAVTTMAEPSTDRQAAQRAIQRARTGSGTRLYDAIHETLRNRRFQEHRGRKAIVVFTDGVDTGSFLPQVASLREVEEADVFIYPIHYLTPAEKAIQLLTAAGKKVPAKVYKGDFAKAEKYLRDLTRITGSRFYSAASIPELSHSFSLIAGELRKHYTIGYYPAFPAAPGQRRRINVQVKKNNVILRARESYIAAPEQEAK